MKVKRIVKFNIKKSHIDYKYIQTQQENTTLVSCVVLLKTLLERKGLKYSENS